MVFGFRFCIEFIKNPQENFEESMMFNMGQLLSAPFIVLGITTLIVSARQEKPAPLLDPFRLPQQKTKIVKPQPAKQIPPKGRQQSNSKHKKKKK
jgi:prolipoprotein diacylglyceryltransferase